LPSVEELDDLDFDDITIAGDMVLADEVADKKEDEEDEEGIVVCVIDVCCIDGRLPKHGTSPRHC